MASELFTQSIGKTSSGYKVILSYDAYNEATHNSETKYAEIDVLDGGLDVKSNVELTSHPTLKGHNISDHIYRLPIDISIKGSFADNGLKAYNWIGEDRLTRIQSEFEACQRAGVKFNIVMIKNDDVTDHTNYRFLARKNMVLTNISWTQHQHTLSFNFTFKEALSSNLQIVDVKKDMSDPNLPAITELSAASLIGEIISSNDVIQMTIEVLRSLELVNDATFWKAVGLATLGTAGTALFGYLAVGLTAISVKAVVAILAAAGTTATVPVVGWVISAALAIVAGICAIFGWIAAVKRAEQIEHYKKLGHVFLIDDNMTDDEQQEVAVNFIKFLAEVKTAVDDALSNISIFRIAKADRQECALLVNGSYYVQRIEKNDDDLSYRIDSYYLGQTHNASLPKIVALESFADCTKDSSSIYFYDKYGVAGSSYRVYIVSRSAYKQEMTNQPTNEDLLSNMTENYLTDQEKYEDEKENLLDFAFVVSPYPLTDLTDKIETVIKNMVG